MMPMLSIGAERFALLLGLSLFFGFAFEDFYAGELPRRPGGVRTFPLLALAGGGLYLLEPRYGAAFIGGLVVLGSWIYAWVRQQCKQEAPAVEGAFVVPVCNVLAYLLGPLALTQPLWLCVSVAVVAVLLLGGRRRLHDWAARVSPANSHPRRRHSAAPRRTPSAAIHDDNAVWRLACRRRRLLDLVR